MDVFDRFQLWMNDTGRSQAAAARDLNVDQSFVSKIVARERRPGRSTACAIERLTSEWGHGPIRPVEWDAEVRDA
jgi:DNA-binding transcriptional regulator YdaS (Cro superfamily)